MIQTVLIKNYETEIKVRCVHLKFSISCTIMIKKIKLNNFTYSEIKQCHEIDKKNMKQGDLDVAQETTII